MGTDINAVDAILFGMLFCVFSFFLGHIVGGLDRLHQVEALVAARDRLVTEMKKKAAAAAAAAIMEANLDD